MILCSVIFKKIRRFSMDENHPTILEQISLLYDINIPTEHLSHIFTQIDDFNVGMIKLSTIISPEVLN